MKRIIRNREISEGAKINILFQNLVSTFLGVVESLLFLRFVLRLFGANAASWFVDFIYSISAFFKKPFNNIFENIKLQENMILEVDTIIAMIVYSLLGWLIISVFIIPLSKRIKEEVIDIE